MQKAFSLVELSIVLVILGLLTGGILAGQSLIQAAQLRSISTEYSRYMAAVHGFRDKYLALPGDITNATSFWGKDNTNCNTAAGAVATPGTCNGDGNGIISDVNGVERHRLWQHLAFAGLVEGTYSGLGTDGAAGYGVTPGENAPLSKFGNKAGWSLGTLGTGGTTWAYDLEYGNSMLLGAIYPSTGATSFPRSPILKPEDAWNLDTKMDDGRPAYGKIVAYYWNNLCAAPNSGALVNTNLDASYLISDQSIRCILLFRKIV